MPSCKKEMDAYVGALCQEIESYQRLPKIQIDTIFFGGGTPTLLGVEHLCALLSKIRSVFIVSSDTEISFEMNPATATEDMLRKLFLAGFNRLSIGVQSLSDTELQTLGRAHTAHEALQSIAWAKSAGFQNINVDVMYAIPGQTRESFRKTLTTLHSLDIPHISAYGLILEEGTKFWDNRGTLVFASDEDEMSMYEDALSILSKAGYEHYEISNYAKDGYVCRHNMKYWQLKPYIGIGVAAHSYYDGIRFENEPNIDAYISYPFSVKKIEENPTNEDLAEEYAMLGLRTKEGISLTVYEHLAGHPFAQGKQDILLRCEGEGYLQISGDNIRFTDKGFGVSLSILAEFLS